MSKPLFLATGPAIEVIDAEDGTRRILIDGKEHRGISNAKVDMNPLELTTVTVTFMPSKIEFTKGFTAATKKESK